MVVFFFLFWTRSRDTRYNGKIERAKESDWHKINTVARNRKKRLVIGAWIVAAMHRLEKADLRVERLRGALRSSRGSVKGRVKNNRANRKGRRRDRLRPFENSSCDFFFSPPLSSFSFFFFFFHSGNGEVKTRERFCRNFNYFLLTPCRGYLCNTAGPPAWFRSSDRRVNSTQDLLWPFYTGSHNM